MARKSLKQASVRHQKASSLLVPGGFTSHFGLKLPFKIDCDALSDSELGVLAGIVAHSELGEIKYGEIVGIPRGGVRLAEALKKVLWLGGTDILIVDDVLTTGSSMDEFKDRQYLKSKLDPLWRVTSVRGVVIFARGPCPWWVYPIFQMPQWARGENEEDKVWGMASA